VNCAVCTLFEGDYHLGTAVLVKSLCRAGFGGTIYAGFRGPLPPWTESRIKETGKGEWEMYVTRDVRLVFLTVNTSAHFTNYKPDFLLQIEARGGSESAIYCDPDIVLNGSWRYVEEWLSCGVALCEDINSPLHRNNPRRVGWRRFFEPLGHHLEYRGAEYANGGFIGLTWQHRELLVTWKNFLDQITKSLGGADIVGIGGGRRLEGHYGFADCFHQPDQDALNAALEAHPEIPASILGPLAMGFEGGTPLLPHALGGAKPWRRSYLRDALGGRPPQAVDKIFWEKVDGPLWPFSRRALALKRIQLRLAAGSGRVMRRN